LSDEKGAKQCPICDSPLEHGSKKCSFCGTDLTIFDTASEAPAAEQEEAAPSSSEPEKEEALDSQLEEVFFGGAEEAETEPAEERVVEEEPSEVAEAEPEPEPEPEPEVEPEPAAAPAEEEAVEGAVQETVEEPAAEFFECPECGGKVAASATSCPNCGVMFADEGGDMFQCPACNTLVNIDAKACPGCGAVFVDSEEAAEEVAAESEASVQEDMKPELETPVAEVPSEPETEIGSMFGRRLEESEEEPEKKKLFGWLGKMKIKKKDKDEAAEAPEGIAADVPEAEAAESEPESEVVVSEPPVREMPQPVVAREPEPVRELAEPQPVREPEQRPAAAPPAPPKDKAKDKVKGKELARLTAEIQPLMRLAMEKGVDISGARKSVDDVATSVRARQVDNALESAKLALKQLTERMNESIDDMISDLRNETDVAKALGGEVSRASAYLGELTKARKSGDFEAVYIYHEKVKNELLPITGRYNESRQKISSLRNLITDSEVVYANTKDVKQLLAEATKAFDGNDFDKVDIAVRTATDKLYKEIEPRMEEEIKRAKNLLVEVKDKGTNITPMLTVLKSARSLMKAKDYPQALREMREFKEQVRRAS
jgi:hypothetical protein